MPDSELGSSTGKPAPSLRTGILAWALILGCFGCVAGVVEALLFKPGNNLAPIVGFILVGPICGTLGLGVGVALAIPRLAPAQLLEAAVWLVTSSVIQCSLYVGWSLVLPARAAVVVAMMVSIGVGAALLVHAVWRLRAGLRVGLVILAVTLGATAMLVVSLFPPVQASRWENDPRRNIAVPTQVFFLDRRLPTDPNVRHTLRIDEDAYQDFGVRTLIVTLAMCVVFIGWPRRGGE